MSTIENTVTEALRSAGHGDYIRYADQPIDALVQREQGIAQGIITVAVDQGMDRSQVVSLLTSLDMHVPAETTEAEAPASNGLPVDSVEAALAQINRTLDAIKRAAADNGITIRA